MAKNFSNRFRKRKALIAMLCALSVTCTGLAAACAPNEEDEPSTEVTAKEDVQLLKNGNFEHFDIPDKAVHLIKNVNSWSLGGDSSVMSGIIGTSASDWDKLTDPSLAETLDINNDLTSDNEDYVNYNSMRSRDILYKDNSAALLDSENVADTYWLNNQGYENYFGIQEKDGKYYIGETEVYKNEDDGEYYFDDLFTELVRKEMISNPGTHWGDFEEKDGKYYYGDEQVYVDGEGRYYFDENLKDKPVGNILMIHNSPTDTTNNNGLHQYYSSTSITLEAQTSAEISVWVKTSDLRFDKGYFAGENEEDKGAYIEVVQTVAGTTLDSFQIKAINTEKIISGADNGVTTTASNGWVQYTVYVNACDFADTTVQLKLGLGGTENNEKVTGYAFFDDVEVTKYRDLTSEGCTYDASKVTNTTCNLTDEEEDKIFYADVAINGDKRNAYDFNYLIDLASEQGVEGSYNKFEFGKNVEAGLTTETDSKGVEYAAAESIAENVIKSSVNSKEQGTLKLPKDVQARPTGLDIIGAYSLTPEFSGDYKKVLEEGLAGADKLPAADGNMLVMFSAWGAPYTSTISDSATFNLDKDEYLLISFWVKTSDMDGSTAATVKIYELDTKTNLPDETTAQSLSLDTTDMTTDFEDEKDIYNGWVQCFFFVKNETKDAKQFYIDFSFGTTAITTTTAYEGGWAALANMRTLEIDKDVYDLASASDNTALFAFNKNNDEDDGTPFDEATGTSNIKEEIAVPGNYTGRNGANVAGYLNSDAPVAGLINREYIEKYSSVLSSFTNGEANWTNAFGDNCYQPLIIINNLREYASVATANETTFKDYWVKDGDNYVKVASDATYDEKETYYSLNKVANYGYVSASKTVAANSREVISVRVKVTGNAEAYIYLVNDETNEILNYTTPTYTFWYDEEGNVLDAERDEDWTTAQHREHIVYTVRDDGLYEDKDGNAVANLYNLVKSYSDSKYEHNDFYERFENNGVVTFEPISFDDLKDGETYYGTSHTVADHYLCNSDGTRVYEYINGEYYYLENHEPTTKVSNFDPSIARYSNSDIDEKLYAVVTADDCASLGDDDGWVTVNFVVTTGSESKGYRLELWSGAKDETGVDANGNMINSGAVAFDYSYATVSEARLAAYEAEIIQAYHDLLLSKNDASLFDEIPSGTKENIASYEKALDNLVKAGKLTETEVNIIKDTYSASYYSFTLYDSASYVPFNVNTAADGETGYNYDASLFTEQLAYFAFNDEKRSEMNVFVDYTAVDQSIEMNTASDEEETEDEDNAGSAELGLYISSIVLVVVLLITLASILITQYVKNRRKKKGAKNSDKNVYRKRDRYVKKLHLVKEEMVEPETAEPVPEAEPVAPAEEPAPAEPVEETSETPAEEENPEDGENKE